MAGKVRFKMTERGFNELMQTHFSHVVEHAGTLVAEKVRAGLPSGVEVGTVSGIGRNGRPYSLVTVMHPMGLAVQAKRGVLTRAALATGLDVHRSAL